MSGFIDEMKRVVASVVGCEIQADKIVFALMKNFGGERLYIPSNDYESRNREIRELYRSGASVDKLSARYRVSVRTVYRIIESD